MSTSRSSSERPSWPDLRTDPPGNALELCLVRHHFLTSEPGAIKKTSLEVLTHRNEDEIHGHQGEGTTPGLP